MEKGNTIEFLSVDINFRTTLDIGELMGAINIGAITLKKEDREYILDPLKTYFTHEKGGGTNVCCYLDSYEGTLDVFDECKYDMTDSDFVGRNFDKAEMFLEFEESNTLHATDYYSDVESITLSYKYGDMTIVADLEPETFEIVD